MLCSANIINSYSIKKNRPIVFFTNQLQHTNVRKNKNFFLSCNLSGVGKRAICSWLYRIKFVKRKCVLERSYYACTGRKIVINEPNSGRIN